MAENASALVDQQSRLTYLTRHYYELQTMRFAPVWIAFLADLAYNSRPGHWVASSAAGRTLPFLGMVCVEILWYWMVTRYYRWRVGHLEVKQTVLTIGFNWWVVYSTLQSCFRAPWSNAPWSWSGSPPVSGAAIAIMLSLPFIEFRNPPSRRVGYALGTAAIVLVTFLSSREGWDARALIVTTCLTALTLCVADHLLLMSLCAPVREGADG